MSAVQTIPIANLALAFIPVAVVLGVLVRWSLDTPETLYALARMLAQLVLIGYVLVFIFETEHFAVVAGVLALMLGVSSWIALRPLAMRGLALYAMTVASMATGGLFTLLVVTQGVLGLEPWFEPRFMVPLAGMTFANAMNAVSLAAERFEAERASAQPYEEARRTALRAALIPITNSLLAVGLVSLPGMMTGQILAGVSPLIAVRYQIMVMCMIFGGSGIAAVCYLVLVRSRPPPPAQSSSEVTR